LTTISRFELAKRFLEALDSESDEAVYKVHLDANTDHELYQEVWWTLGSEVRAAIKTSIEFFEKYGHDLKR
jgi:hypothetical protein